MRWVLPSGAVLVAEETRLGGRPRRRWVPLLLLGGGVCIPEEAEPDSMTDLCRFNFVGVLVVELLFRRRFVGEVTPGSKDGTWAWKVVIIEFSPSVDGGCRFRPPGVRELDDSGRLLKSSGSVLCHFSWPLGLDLRADMVAGGLRRSQLLWYGELGSGICNQPILNSSTSSDPTKLLLQSQ